VIRRTTTYYYAHLFKFLDLALVKEGKNIGSCSLGLLGLFFCCRCIIASLFRLLLSLLLLLFLLLFLVLGGEEGQEG
jgi:hypothetical protein